MTDTPIRNTDQRVASYRRYILDTVIAALKVTFDSGYDRERQLANWKILPQYPRDKQKYPCIVVSYQGSQVRNAGVGHEEWFDDANGVRQKWNHRYFTGEVEFAIYALSTIDRDIALDALVEVLSFGRLDAALLPFFTTIYGDPHDPVRLLFNQLALGVDVLTEQPNSVTTPPWQSENELLYTTGVTVDAMGGFYNIVPDVRWKFVERVEAHSYPQFEQSVTIPHDVPDEFFGPPTTTPLADAPGEITNPRQFYDATTVRGTSVVSADEEYDPA